MNIVYVIDKRENEIDTKNGLFLYDHRWVKKNDLKVKIKSKMAILIGAFEREIQ